MEFLYPHINLRSPLKHTLILRILEEATTGTFPFRKRYWHLHVAHIRASFCAYECKQKPRSPLTWLNVQVDPLHYNPHHLSTLRRPDRLQAHHDHLVARRLPQVRTLVDQCRVGHLQQLNIITVEVRHRSSQGLVVRSTGTLAYLLQIRGMAPHRDFHNSDLFFIDQGIRHCCACLCQRVMVNG